MRWQVAVLLTAALAGGAAVPAVAAPWASVGNDQLRSDLTLLNDAGIAQTMVTQWPVPWRGVLDALQDSPTLDAQPRYIREAIRRVRARATRETAEGGRAETLLDGTNRPALVRGFDAEGYGKGTIQETRRDHRRAAPTSMSSWARSPGRRGSTASMFDADGSYLAQRFGNFQLYGGARHRIGGGQAGRSALTYSATTRGRFRRSASRPTGPLRFKTPLLSWIGPFRAEALVGVLDDTRIARTGPLFNGIRVHPQSDARPRDRRHRGSQILLRHRTHPCGISDIIRPEQQRSKNGRARRRARANSTSRYGFRLGDVPVEVYTARSSTRTRSPITHSYSRVISPAAAFTCRLGATPMRHDG